MFYGASILPNSKVSNKTCVPQVKRLRDSKELNLFLKILPSLLSKPTKNSMGRKTGLITQLPSFMKSTVVKKFWTHCRSTQKKNRSFIGLNVSFKSKLHLDR